MPSDSDHSADSDITTAVNSDNETDPLVIEAEFWKAFEIDADWIEYYPTLKEMAAGADLVAVGTILSVSLNVHRGDAEEDIFGGAVVTVQITELLSGALDGTSFALNLIVTIPVTPDTAEQIEADLNAVKPAGPILFLLRSVETGYRVVNGYGLWTRTLRDDIDDPLNPEYLDINIYADELSEMEILEDLVAYLR